MNHDVFAPRSWKRSTNLIQRIWTRKNTNPVVVLAVSQGAKYVMYVDSARNPKPPVFKSKAKWFGRLAIHEALTRWRDRVGALVSKGNRLTLTGDYTLFMQEPAMKAISRDFTATTDINKFRQAAAASRWAPKWLEEYGDELFAVVKEVLHHAELHKKMLISNLSWLNQNQRFQRFFPVPLYFQVENTVLFFFLLESVRISIEYQLIFPCFCHCNSGDHEILVEKIEFFAAV